jgi:hypothetical protein
MLSVDSSKLKQQIKSLLFNDECRELFGSSNCQLISDSLDNEAAFPYILELATEIDQILFNDFSPFGREKIKHSIMKKVEGLKVFLFRQRTILIAVPQRKRHPQFPAPNLGGLVVPQAYRVKGEVCYGMNYCDARTFLVRKALEDPSITDILFVDDDILLPKNAISVLCDTNEPIVAANYVKKQYPIETTALQVREINGIVHNQEIKAIEGAMAPIPVSQMGLGACLISVEVFKKLKEPWFEFKYNADGSVFAGEDVRFMQQAILAGYEPKIIPGLVCAHIEFKSGKAWGPIFMVKNRQIRPDMKDQFCYMLCDPKECHSENIK